MVIAQGNKESRIISLYEELLVLLASSFLIKLISYCIYIYRIYLIKRPGVYFISKSVKGAFKRGGRLFKEGVY